MDDEIISRSHISFLERSINLLIIDGVAEDYNAYHEFLNSYKLYNVTRVSTAQEANALLLSPKRFHVCLTDLGNCDVQIFKSLKRRPQRRGNGKQLRL